MTTGTHEPGLWQLPALVLLQSHLQRAWNERCVGFGDWRLKFALAAVRVFFAAAAAAGAGVIAAGLGHGSRLPAKFRNLAVR
ncbi:hypothetical protein, partial [Rhodoferax sp.]|uniref:hypothetical protein n=1 Tax=Rhodoferax sp. TaxID=50421 RepID=UPI0025CC8A4A